MNIKNTVLIALMVAVVGSAVTMALFVADAISKQNMVDTLTKGGWVLLILTLAMVVVGFIKQSGQK